MNRLVHILYRIDSRKCTKRGRKLKEHPKYIMIGPGWCHYSPPVRAANGSRNGLPESACVHDASQAVPPRPASPQRRPKPKVRVTECWILGGPWSNTCTKCIKKAI